MKKQFAVLLLILFSSLSISAQSVNERFCETMQADSFRRALHPETGSLNDFENWLQQQIALQKNNLSTQAAPVLTIPVIVHVIHDGEAVGTGRNISAAQVYSQITVFNEDFRRLNADTGNTPSVFKNVAADFEIEFCIAQINPNGTQMSEPGINRINRNSLGFTAPPYVRIYTDTAIKPTTGWDPKKYMNIWVLDLSGGIAGYGQFPDSSGLSGAGYTPNATAQTDGITMHYRCFGTTGNLLGGYNKGRSATHEAGHWLGLRHIWGDSNCGNDHCGDTPTQQGYYTGCPAFPQVTCSNGPNGAMFTNFMDYTSDACKNIFTANQKTRARTVMQVSPRRKELPYSTVCIAPVVSNFTASDTIFCEGESITFNDQSINSPTYWNWTFQGGTPSSSTLQNPSITYTAAGVYSVTLAADNINGGTPKLKVAYLQVNPYPNVAVSNDTALCNGDTLQLTSSGAQNYLWAPASGLNSNTIANPLFTGSATTTFTLQGTTNGCSTVKTISVTVYPVNTPTITLFGNTLTSSAATTYQWYRNDTLIIGATSQTYTTTINATYKVVTTNSDGCVSEAELIVLNIGTYSISQSKNILIFPNPSNGETTIVLPQKNCFVSIKNILGEVVYQTLSQENKISFSVTTKGIYIVTIADINGNSYSEKIIVK